MFLQLEIRWSTLCSQGFESLPLRHRSGFYTGLKPYRGALPSNGPPVPNALGRDKPTLSPIPGSRIVDGVISSPTLWDSPAR